MTWDRLANLADQQVWDRRIRVRMIIGRFWLCCHDGASVFTVELDACVSD